MILTINLPNYETAERTILTDPVASSATSLNVKNSQGYDATNYVVVNEIGTETAELRQIGAITNDTAFTVDALDFSHSEGEPVIYSQYNQVRIYRATSKTGTYSLLATSAIDVDNSNMVTVYDDTTGTSTHWYKIDYYNSTTTASSSLSDPIPATGVESDTVRYITDQILKEARDTEEAVTDREEILDWLNDCNDDVASRRVKWRFLYTRTTCSTVASQEYYDLTDDFNATDIDKIHHLVYNYDDGTSDLMYRLRYITEEEFDILTENNDLTANDVLQKFTVDEARSYIRVYPKPSSSGKTLYLYYYKNPTFLNSDGDELIIPDKRVYKYYCLHQFHLKKQDINMANIYSGKYEQAVQNLVRKQRREVGQPRSFRYVPNNIRNYFKY